MNLVKKKKDEMDGHPTTCKYMIEGMLYMTIINNWLLLECYPPMEHSESAYQCSKHLQKTCNKW